MTNIKLLIRYHTKHCDTGMILIKAPNADARVPRVLIYAPCWRTRAACDLSWVYLL